MKKELTRESLREILHYDLNTGIFTWEVNIGGRALTGSRTGTINGKGYAIIGINRKMYYAHRLAFLYVLGWLPEQVDHQDHDKSNNRWINLQPANRAINAKNCPLYACNKSGTSGVVWFKRDKKWLAQIKVDSKQIWLGLFETKQEAIQVRKSAEARYGFHENHGMKLNK